MLKTLLLSVSISALLCAEISFDEINSKPPSRAKNFLIWQYLKQDINSYQADKVYKQVLGSHYKIDKLYLQKSDNKALKHKILCQNEVKLLDIKDEKCLKLALTPFKTLQLTPEQRLKIVPKLNSKAKIQLLKIQNEQNLEKAYNKYDADTVLNFFNLCGNRYRRANLNIAFSREFMNKLSKSAKIQRFIEIVLRDKKLYNLQKSLLKINGHNLSSQNNFLIGLIALNNNKENLALSYFQLGYKLAKKDSQKDKNLFWAYQISKDKRYLQKMLQSKDINIYSLYAYDLMDKEPQNFFTTTDVKDSLSSKNLQDPFEWKKILEQIKETPKEKLFELSKEYEQKNMIAVNAFVLERAYRYKKHAFIMPYEKYLEDVTLDDKALIYAIMRQESNYIPSAISRSFALGLMQLMPFLVDAIAKESKEQIEYKDMFIPEKNIEYAIKHLNWMKKTIKHPLFMAYGYNGGTGFLRRHLATGAFTHGKYEPYLSMEMMGNAQTREYGKRVLANYVMYKKILGKKSSIVSIFENVIYSNHILYSRG